MHPSTDLPSADDETLVMACRAGNARAWECLVRRYQRLVYAIARRAGLDEHHSADIFQTTFTRLFQQIDRLSDPSKVQAWIVTTAKRETQLEIQRGRRGVSMTAASEDGEDWDMADGTPIPEELLSDLQEVHQVRVALDQLDDRCRELLILVFKDEDERLPYEEVASRLGMAVGSIGPTRSRCLGKLRRLLEN